MSDEAAAAKEMIAEHMEEIAGLIAEEKDLKATLADTCAEEVSQIEELSTRIVSMQNEIEDLVVSMETKDPELVETIALCRREIDRKKNSLKAACYNLPLSVLKSGLSHEDFNVRVSISRTSIKTSYRTDELLAAHPDIADLSVDGDPVVTRAIDPAVFGRLVAEEIIDEELAAAYRVETKIKNPSVRIIEEVENG